MDSKDNKKRLTEKCVICRQPIHDSFLPTSLHTTLRIKKFRPYFKRLFHEQCMKRWILSVTTVAPTTLRITHVNRSTPVTI